MYKKSTVNVQFNMFFFKNFVIGCMCQLFMTSNCICAHISPHSFPTQYCHFVKHELSGDQKTATNPQWMFPVKSKYNGISQKLPLCISIHNLDIQYIMCGLGITAQTGEMEECWTQIKTSAGFRLFLFLYTQPTTILLVPSL